MCKRIFTNRLTRGAVKIILAAALAFSLPGGPGPQVVQAAGAVIRVTTTGLDLPGCGDTWANACSLQYALTTAAVSGDEIWAAAGTYKPALPGGARTATFQLKAGVAVYGGFNGSEVLRDERNWTANLTTLSGDLNGNDSGWTNIGENSYHVVTGASGATLDGFTITGGNASTAPDDRGGGMLNTSVSPTLANLVFTRNSASNTGGGMCNYTNSSPTITNVTFSGNRAHQGGGMFNHSNSNPTLTHVTFSGNTFTGSGGGIHNNSSNPILLNVTFSNNIHSASNTDGGGMYNYQSNPSLTNVTFSNNSASRYGGGMSNSDNCYMLMVNATFTGNQAFQGGGIFKNGWGALTIYNSILWGNSAGVPSSSQIGNYDQLLEVRYSDIQGGWPGTGNINADPQLGPLANNGGFTQTRALGPGSAAIDTAESAHCPAADQRGQPRNDLGCDMGAYELKYPDSDSVFRPVSSTALTTFGPTLAGIQRNAAFTDPGLITIYKKDHWETQGPESIQTWWKIIPTTASGINTTLQLCYTDAESNGRSLASLRFWRHDAAGWNQVGGVPVTSRDAFGNNCARISGVQDFGYSWTLAVSQPTAIQLISFSAAPADRRGGAWVLFPGRVFGVIGVFLLARRRGLSLRK